MAHSIAATFTSLGACIGTSKIGSKEPASRVHGCRIVI